MATELVTGEGGRRSDLWVIPQAIKANNVLTQKVAKTFCGTRVVVSQWNIFRDPGDIFFNLKRETIHKLSH